MIRQQKGRWSGARERRLEPGRRSLTASEAAAVIGVSVATVRGWADQGRLPVHRTVGGHRRFELEELKGWLAERGAPVPTRVRPARAHPDIPRCPELARALDARAEAVADRLLAGYADEVPTTYPMPPLQELRRIAARFARVVAGALETGDPSSLTSRAELLGYRGALQGDGEAVLVEQTRLAVALVREAEEAVREGDVQEEFALPALQWAIEHAQAGAARGMCAAMADDPGRAGAV
jgi:excisionase family DNA binding protein